MRRSSMIRAVLFAGAALAATAAAAQTPTSAPSEVVRFGTWGVDLSTRDLKARPGDDFQRYASGHWMDITEIPADKSQNGVGSELNDRIQEQLRAIVASAPPTAIACGGPRRTC